MNITGRFQRGFTLIEAIMVIVITGIIGSMVAVFIKTSIDSYLAAERRAELTEAADIALRRLAREVRLALPNSLRVTTGGGFSYIEFIPTSDGGRYRAAGDGSTGGNILDFTGTVTNPCGNNTCFDVLGSCTANAPNIAANDYIVVYNLGQGYSPADAYTGGNRAQVSSVSPGTTCFVPPVTPYSVTLSANVFGGQLPPLPSPNNRFQVVPGGMQAVTYGCPSPLTATPGTMTRYWNYGFNASQTTTLPPGGTTATVVANATCEVDYLQNAEQRNGILYITLKVSDIPSGETVSVFQQIHVDNSP